MRTGDPCPHAHSVSASEIRDVLTERPKPDQSPAKTPGARTTREEIIAAAERYLKGGSRRRELLETLTERLTGTQVRTTDEKAADEAARAIAKAVAELPDPEPSPVENPPTTSGTIYTDGSAVPNPGAGGWAAVWIDGGKVVQEKAGNDPETTNNRMELKALIAAFNMIPTGAAVEVVTDSQLCVNTATTWAAAWRRAGWRKKKGQIANLDLVKELFALYKAHPECTLRWTRGHAGNRWNEYADRLANAARTL